MTAEQAMLILLFGFTGAIMAVVFLYAIVYLFWMIVISAAIAIAQNKKER